ncbi:MAG: ParB N-terminal domain-containing protein [Anaerolineae bacterium]|nr:ParB N-terminal domain-containing protein [Anaerolineae bacterium]
MPSTNLEATDAAIYSQFAEVDAGKRIIRPVSIFEIMPDPLQPRRAVPSPVRPYWDGRPDSVSNLFSNWYHLAEQECGEEFKVEPYLLGHDDAVRPDQMGPILASFLDVIELAANIRQNGLMNPITIGRTADGYRLETGERRWLAYHILHISFEDEHKQWEKIPADVVKELSVWRQASENNARANLNAIGRARQLAILIMDAYQRRGASFQTYQNLVDTSGIDRAYYAQVADGKTYPVTGFNEMLMNALGFKQDSQMREHRALLNLPDEVWRIADDLNWTQGHLRDLKRQAGDDPDLLIRLARLDAVKDGYTVGIPTPDDSPPPPRKSRELVENDLFSAEDEGRFAALRKLALKVGQGDKAIKPSDLVAVRYEIQQMRQWLDRLDQAAQNRFKKL